MTGPRTESTPLIIRFCAARSPTPSDNSSRQRRWRLTPARLSHNRYIILVDRERTVRLPKLGLEPWVLLIILAV